MDFGFPKDEPADKCTKRRKMTAGFGLLCLPDKIAAAAAEIRRQGKRITVRRQGWDDNGAEFRIPNEPGFAVIWRDDIPSLPVLFGLENLSDEVIQALADQLWYWSGFSNKAIPVSYPLGTNEPILLGVSQASSAANNYLSKLLDTSGLSIDFAFLAGKPFGSQFDLYNDITTLPFLGIVDADLTSANPQDINSIKTVVRNDVLYNVNKYDLAGNPLISNSQTRPAPVSIRPEINAPGNSNVPDRAFQLQLAAKLTITKDLPQPVTFHVRLRPVVTFSPRALEIPTAAIFFTDANFAGIPMIVMPRNTFGLSGKWDANNPSLPKKNEVCGALDTIKTALDTICFFTGNSSLELLRKGIGCIDAWAQSIIDATGDISDLGGSIIDMGTFLCGIQFGG
jgi:hypothetical protein